MYSCIQSLVLAFTWLEVGLFGPDGHIKDIWMFRWVCCQSVMHSSLLLAFTHSCWRSHIMACNQSSLLTFLSSCLHSPLVYSMSHFACIHTCNTYLIHGFA
jgi:hypothetical protein